MAEPSPFSSLELAGMAVGPSKKRPVHNIYKTRLSALPQKALLQENQTLLMIVQGNKVYQLFADCIPVMGHLRGAIYDLTRGNFEFIPKELCQILLNDSERHENRLSDDLLNFLLENEFLFECDEEDQGRFPKLELQWDHHALINNAIIDITQLDLPVLIATLRNINDLGCENFQLWDRGTDPIDLERMKALTQGIAGSSILNLELLKNTNGTIHYKPALALIEEKCALG